MNIGFAISGSFCTHDKILKEISTLIDKGHNVMPILSNSSSTTNTRFGKAKDLISRLTDITKNIPISSIVDAEPIGPQGLIDVLVVAPCTGNTLSKIANAITDTPITMITKAHLRNNKPVVIGISSNDALGLNMKNLATLMSAKNIYFIPFGQDDPIKKPNSLISDFSMIEQTIKKAMQGEQIQPILLH